MVCTKQLCDYRDHLEQFVQLGVQIVGISKNSTSEHIKFARAHKFPFLLLSDSGQSVAKMYGCTSLLMMGTVSRAVFIVNTQGIILYRYVEPIALTRRTADELLDVISDLKGNQLI
jgi:peroxiredoxin Q/BCP